MNFFLQKQLITFRCTYQPLSFFKILKKIFEPIQSYEDAPFLGPNSPLILKIFLVKTIIIAFIQLLALFIVQNFKKFLQWIQSYQDLSFLGPKWSICLKQIVFGKLLISFSSTYQPVIVQNFQKILPADPELQGCTVFRKPVHELCSFNSCLSTYQKSN